MHLHLDAIGGVAGDMFIAALSEAFPALRPGLLRAVRQAGLPETVSCAFEAHHDGVLSGARFRVDIPRAFLGADAHGHTAFADIKSRLRASELPEEVKARAIDIFTRLAQVEAGIHGTSVEAVGFHELGGWDSIADMVGAAYLIAELQLQSCSVSKLPLGAGRVMTSHGPLPVPVPAVTQLLQGFEFVDDHIGGERITPTGAAILCHLQAHQGARPAGRMSHSGYGFGSKRFAGISNVLRALVLETAGTGETDQIGRITFEVDDQSPEDLAIGLERVRACEGVLDVIQIPVFGKKGRLGVQVQVLVRAALVDAVCDACLSETSTLGVRHEIVQRKILSRSATQVRVGDHSVRVKLAQRGAAPSAKAESDDIQSAGGDRDARRGLRHAAQTTALAERARARKTGE